MLRKLLDDGWEYHDVESERLARELEAAADAGVSTDLSASFLHLSTHTIGQHLGDWPRALALGKRILRGRESIARGEEVACSGEEAERIVEEILSPPACWGVARGRTTSRSD
jgi:hypothetical protein